MNLPSQEVVDATYQWVTPDQAEKLTARALGRVVDAYLAGKIQLSKRFES
jgi:hypothetical protein